MSDELSIWDKEGEYEGKSESRTISEILTTLNSHWLVWLLMQEQRDMNVCEDQHFKTKKWDMRGNLNPEINLKFGLLLIRSPHGLVWLTVTMEGHMWEIRLTF